jgi:cation:H+ antiporter
MLLYLILFFAGLLLLYYGAEWLVKGSSDLARSLGITPIVIGLTVVAFGTSTPELVVSLVSAFKGKSMIAVGNVVGSNICNIALVLGLASVLMPIKSDPSVRRRDIPIMLGISLYLLLLSLDSSISRWEGGTLFAGIILYTLFNYILWLRSTAHPGAPFRGDTATLPNTSATVAPRRRQIGLIVAGIAGVVAGAEMLVDSAVNMMQYFGVSQKFIGLTVVAFGTSLPELATSAVAAVRKEMDISIGNLVGSNVFNILSVLGAAALVRPITIPGGFFQSGLIIDVLVMMFTSFLPWLMLGKNMTLGRVQGLILLSCYGGYLAYLINMG